MADRLRIAIRALRDAREAFALIEYESGEHITESLAEDHKQLIDDAFIDMDLPGKDTVPDRHVLGVGEPRFATDYTGQLGRMIAVYSGGKLSALTMPLNLDGRYRLILEKEPAS